MKNFLRTAAFLAALVLAQPALAAVGIIYVDTGGTATNSGTTDTNAAVISGTAAAWTTGTNVITLDTNTNIGSVPGCSAGTCDGSQAIYLNNATNSIDNIFWIASYTGCTGTGACVVTTSGAPAAPTCASCSGSSWAIGGRYVWPSGAGVNVVVGAIRIGDTIQFNNTPATKTVTYATLTPSTTLTGNFFFQGKAGVMPVLETTNTTTTLTGSGGGWIVRNIAFKQDGASGNAITGFSTGTVYNNIKITAAGGTCLNIANVNNFVLYSEITGCGQDGISFVNGTIAFSYIHNNVRDGIRFPSSTGGSMTLVYSVVTNNGGRGIYWTGNSYTSTQFGVFVGNTIALNTNSGLEVTSADQGVNISNNIFYNNGGATGQFNVLWDNGSLENLPAVHQYNDFFHSNCQGSNTGGPACVSGLTTNATEQTSDPSFVASGSGNFAINAGGGAAAHGFPGAIGSSTGFLDIGAIQRQVTAGGGATGALRPGIGQ